MDIFQILLSISKVSVIAFILTAVFLGYELFLFSKERSKSSKPNLPQFKEGNFSTFNKDVVLGETEKKNVKKADNKILLILFVLFIVFGAFTLLGFLKVQNTKNTAVPKPTAFISFVASKGIKLYDSDFKLLNDQDSKKAQPGSSIIIGVESVNDPDIDRARIRINKKTWDTEDITLQYNKSQNVYYRTFQIATGESRLTVEAQLHSKVDGWLGE